MLAIETKRRQMKISQTSLCSAAGVAVRTYYDGVRGQPVRPATVAKLNHALKRFQIGFAGEAGAIAPHAAFKACLVLASFMLGADARAALHADPSRRATADPEWLKASRARRLAFSIANQQCGFHVSDVARAAGVTKAAVSTAIKELMDLRDDDPQLDRVMGEIEGIFE
jgi:transcriptional regulator with XRE-family HTH domain